MAGIDHIARVAGVTVPQARSMFAAIVEHAKGNDPNGKPNRIFIKDFGTFRRATRKARTIKSPQIPSGVAEVPEHDVLVFKAMPATKEALNPARAEPAPAAPAPAKPAAKKAPPPPPKKKAKDAPAAE